ncbi:hypothetical protein GQ43DRAFT_146859 [Delitschia confertaspora ATCC 74209]|uniref:Uncharacterized protein n=1 Tax=Delitschia confertaspora ATCC 74209 TaxID=1513339 RepID=A0A9P4MSU7_9PLEO|nr:hypothetical protein GQ43DRAFT_146859 [Delitschia confertaspora ATCC 74209]
MGIRYIRGGRYKEQKTSSANLHKKEKTEEGYLNRTTKTRTSYRITSKQIYKYASRSSIQHQRYIPHRKQNHHTPSRTNSRSPRKPTNPPRRLS